MPFGAFYLDLVFSMPADAAPEILQNLEPLAEAQLLI